MLSLNENDIFMVVSDPFDEMKFVYGAIKENDSFKSVIPVNCSELYKKTHFDKDNFNQGYITTFGNYFSCLYHHAIIRENIENKYISYEDLKTKNSAPMTETELSSYFESRGFSNVNYKSIELKTISNTIHAGMIFKTSISNPNIVSLFVKGSSNEIDVSSNNLSYDFFSSVSSGTNFNECCKFLCSKDNYSYYAISGTYESTINPKYLLNPILHINGINYDNTNILDFYIGIS